MEVNLQYYDPRYSSASPHLDPSLQRANFKKIQIKTFARTRLGRTHRMLSRISKNRANARWLKSQCGRVYFGRSYSECSVNKGIIPIGWAHIHCALRPLLPYFFLSFSVLTSSWSPPHSEQLSFGHREILN